MGADYRMKNTFILGAKETLAMMEAAVEKAKVLEVAVSIAITDVGGHLLHFHRMDGGGAMPVNIAIDKARISATNGRPTKFFQDRVRDNPAMVTIADTVMVQGGLPIIVEGMCIGGVGASGATSEIDEQVAQAALDAL